MAQDQRAGAGQWRYLGTYAFDPAGSPLVVLAGGSDGTLSADAIRFVGAGPAPADLRFVLGDHLGTPQKLTDNTGALVWDRIQTPFGLDHSVTGPAATPVRFPGQYADSENGLSYNYFRDYDPTLGRYIQSDPIGLAGGLNTYGYVGGNPLGYIDPTGENARAMQFWLIAGAGAALAAAAAQHCIDNGIIPSSPPSWPSWGDQAPSSSIPKIPGGVLSEGGTDQEGRPEGVGEGEGGSEAAGETPADERETGITEISPEAKARRKDPERDVGDPNRVVKEGKKYLDTDTGHTVYVKGDKVVVTDGKGKQITQFKNPKSNTSSRIKQGKWVPVQ